MIISLARGSPRPGQMRDAHRAARCRASRQRFDPRHAHLCILRLPRRKSAGQRPARRRTPIATSRWPAIDPASWPSRAAATVFQARSVHPVARSTLRKPAMSPTELYTPCRPTGSRSPGFSGSSSMPRSAAAICERALELSRILGARSRDHDPAWLLVSFFPSAGPSMSVGYCMASLLL